MEEHIKNTIARSQELLLAKQEKDWKARQHCLLQLSESFTSNMKDHEVERAIEWIQPLIPGFQAHMHDLRSTIVRTTCEMISNIAIRAGKKAKPIASALIGTLLSLTNVTIGVVSHSGRTCIKTLVQHTRFDLEPVFEACENKKNEMSCQAACHLLTEILQTWDVPNDVAPHVDRLTSSVHHCLNSRFKRVRRSGCVLLTQMACIWPAKINNFGTMLDKESIRNVFLIEYPDSPMVDWIKASRVKKTRKTSSLKSRIAARTPPVETNVVIHIQPQSRTDGSSGNFEEKSGGFMGSCQRLIDNICSWLTRFKLYLVNVSFETFRIFQDAPTRDKNSDVQVV